MAGELGHVVIEHPDPWAMGEHAAALRDARFSVQMCDGVRFRRAGCPAVIRGRCSLIDRADVVVSYPPRDGTPVHMDVIASVRRAYPGTPVLTADTSGDPMALVEAVTAAAAYVHRPHGRRWWS